MCELSSHGSPSWVRNITMLFLRTRRLSRISIILFVLKSYASFILWKMGSSETLSSLLSLSLLICLLPFWGFSEKNEEGSSSRISALLPISPEGDSLCLSTVSLVVLVSLILYSGKVSSVSLSDTVSSFLIFLRLEGLAAWNKDWEESNFSDTLKGKTDTGFLESAFA
jgi:hypothetical protein